MSRATRSRAPASTPKGSTSQPKPTHTIAKVTDIQPPAWRSRWSTTADLGQWLLVAACFPGFDPPRPGQPEDILTDQNVKQGYNYAENVPVRMNNDNFSAHGLIHSTLMPSRNRSVISLLGDLMSAVYEVRAESTLNIPVHSYKLPPRMTLNDTRRSAWLADLSNPSAPLSKLSRTVLHVTKGPDLLDMLHAHGVAIPRAVWYVRVLGANETLSIKNRQNYNPAQLGIEWAGAVTSHLKKQLQDIVLPSAPRPGLAIKSTFKSTLTQPDTRSKWVSRFAYCSWHGGINGGNSVELLGAFYSEHLVDHAAVLNWLAAQVAPANIAQLYFVLRLLEEYLDDIAEHRMFAQPVIEGCLAKLVEIESCTVPEALTNTTNAIALILQRLMLANSDFFVSARIWAQPAYRRILQTLFRDRAKSTLAELKTDPEGTDVVVLQDMIAAFGNVATRNEAILFRVLPDRSVVDMRATIADVQLLNGINPCTDLSSVSYFQPDGSDDQKLSVLLTWAVTPSQYGTHRPFLACSLLARRAEGTRWQEGIWRWLDESDEVRAVGSWEKDESTLLSAGAGGEDSAKNVWHSRDAVALLVGELVEKGLFSYGWYMQKLIARGITDLSLPKIQSANSHHRTLLHVVPLSSSNAAMTVARSNVLYGDARNPESKSVRLVCRELQVVLMELSGGVNEPWASTTLASLERFLTADRHVLLTVVNDWLLPSVHQFLDCGGQLSSDTFARMIHILSARKCFSNMAELVLAVIQVPCDDVLDLLIAVIERYMNIWTAMDIVNEIGEELFKKHQALRSEQKRCRPLFALLSHLSPAGYLAQDAHHQIESEISFEAQSFHPSTDGTQPPSHSFQQVESILHEPSLERVTAIADEVWYKHHASESWATVIWEHVFASLCNIPNTIPDTQRSEIATRYVAFLVRLNDHIVSGLDTCMREWFSAGMNDMLGVEQAHGIFALVFLKLVLVGVLSPSTILEGLVYPTWNIAASLEESKPPVIVLAGLVNDLTERLLVIDDVPTSPSILPPSTLVEVLGLGARRLPASDNAPFLSLINRFPCLVAMEINPHLSDTVRQSSKALRILLVNQPQIVTLSSRYMDVVRDSFLKPVGLVLTERLELLLVSVLKAIVNGGCTGLPGYKTSPVIDRIKHRPILTRIDPWGVTKASLDLHLTLKLLESSLEQDSSRAEAKERLADFSSSLFGRGMSSQSSDLVAGVLKGISGPVAAKFVNDGLERLTKGLRALKLDVPESVSTFLNDSGITLRLLCRVILPLRDDPSRLPSLESAIKDDFITALQATLEAVLATWKQPDHSVQPRRMEVVTLIARLNHFALGFPGFWTRNTNEKGEALLVTYLRMMRAIGNPQDGDLKLFPILLDTIAFILDGKSEMPKSSKYPLTEPLRQFMDPGRQPILPNLPKEYLDRILPLLRYTPIDPCTGLALRFTQQANRALLITHFQHKPWDWVENIDDSPAGENVRNTASMPLDLFGAEATGDRITQPDTGGPNKLWNSAEKDERHMKTVVGSEVTFQREWVDSRILEYESSGDEAEETDPPAPSEGASSQGGGSRYRDDSRGKKRKASVSSMEAIISDDEIEIIEPPSQNR
ncbi:RNA polymerase II mediator complex subunit [Ceratobasidium sp. 414]|nr:RNA polymerase II mediator complex subunit [Ceratobasidium sp. 414]